MGFYAGDPVGGGWEATLIKGGMTTPTWFNEFTAGGGGSYGAKGWSRMWAHFVLLMGGQAALAWTFNSHLGGEEQALMGLLDHDDRPSWRLGEWARIASDYAKLEKLGFPRRVEPKVAIAYSFENTAAYSANGPSNTSRQYLKTPYLKQAQGAFEPLLKDNVDVAIIKLSYEDLSRYRLIIVPGMYLLDKASTDALRKFVADGGTAIMTAQSAPAQPQIMRPLLRQLYASVGIEPGPKTPDGVFAREVEGRVLYVNTNWAPVDVPIAGAMEGVLGGQRWEGTLRLPALGVELLERRK